MAWNVDVANNIKKLKHKPKRLAVCCGASCPNGSGLVCTRFKGHKGAHGSWGWGWKIEED